MVEQWGVNWDGTVSVATCVTSAVVEGCAIATMCLGLLPHCRGHLSKSNVATFFHLPSHFVHA